MNNSESMYLGWAVSLFGFCLGLAGFGLLLGNSVGRFLGVLFVLCGVYVALYGPAFWMWLTSAI